MADTTKARGAIEASLAARKKAQQAADLAEDALNSALLQASRAGIALVDLTFIVGESAREIMDRMDEARERESMPAEATKPESRAHNVEKGSK